MDKIKMHFEKEAGEFDQIILKLIPYYREMISALIAAIPFEASAKIKVIDLGCGTGSITKKVKETYPNARVTCVDMAENMIEVAKKKLSSHSDIRYQISDFYQFNFSDTYDVVISSLALHHLLTDEDKQNFYSKIYKALSPGGIFYNADVVLASSSHLQDAYMRKWKEFMSKNVSEQEIEEKWIPTYKEEDRPARLMDQLAWLDNIGFVDTDVVWKFYNFAVYGGAKSEPRLSP
ncbi:MAG TPA: class I SAM-dependent methyltransferase [Geobacteraceae bacterium]|nr:class I SAM-dependent methyltransferase [Geobacteraceae bacterium]